MKISIFVLSVLGSIFQVQAIDGVAVSVAYRFSDQCKYCEANERTVPERTVYEKTFWGSLVRYNITNSKVVKKDTLFNLLAHFPQINIEGTKIAFFLNGSRINSSNKLESSGNESGLYLCDIDGKNLTLIYPLKSISEGNVLDWPIGNHIYFHHKQKSLGEIWRVNIVTKQAELVFDYIPESIMTSQAEMRRWTCNANASRALGHVVTEGSAYSKFAHTFVPKNATSDATRSGTIKDCNHGMGPSGNYMAAYYGVGHDHIRMYYWNFKPGEADMFVTINVSDLNKMLGKSSIGKGAEWINFATNSDKWVIQQVGWKGHAGNLDVQGSNAIALNWVDSTAIQISNNPLNADNGVKSISYCNTTGDLWIKPPSGQEGKIELRNGRWVNPLDVGKSDLAPTAIKRISYKLKSRESSLLGVYNVEGKKIHTERIK